MLSEVRNSGAQVQQAAASSSSATSACAKAAEKTDAVAKIRLSEADIERIITCNTHFFHFKESIPSDGQLAKIEEKFEQYKTDKAFQEKRYGNKDSNCIKGLLGDFRLGTDFPDSHVLAFMRSLLLRDLFFAIVKEEHSTMLIEKEDPLLKEKYPQSKITTKASLIELDAYMQRTQRKFKEAHCALSENEKKVWIAVRDAVYCTQYLIRTNQSQQEKGLIYADRIEGVTANELANVMGQIVKNGDVKKWELTERGHLRVVVDRLPN